MAAHESGGFSAELIDLAAGVIGFILAWLFYAPKRRPEASALIAREDGVLGVLRGGLGLDALYRVLFAKPYRALARMFWKGVDNALIDGAAMGSGRIMAWGADIVRPLSTGRLSLYLTVLAAGLAMLLTVLAIGMRS